jgi:DNA-directed RNA polymerase specialized sigma subunit
MISNAELLLIVIRDKKAKKISNELATVWLEIATRRVKNPSFKNFTWNRDDLIAEAMNALCKTGLKFNPTQSDNPFAYFIQVINGAFVKYIAKEKRETDLIEEKEVNVGSDVL